MIRYTSRVRRGFAFLLSRSLRRHCETAIALSRTEPDALPISADTELDILTCLR